MQRQFSDNHGSACNRTGSSATQNRLVATAHGTPVSNTSKLASVQFGGSVNTNRCDHRLPQEETHMIGYFLDLTAPPIGNRPVVNVHDNASTNTPAEWKGHLLDYKFNCQQPHWDEKCI